MCMPRDFPGPTMDRRPTCEWIETMREETMELVEKWLERGISYDQIMARFESEVLILAKDKHRRHQ